MRHRGKGTARTLSMLLAVVANTGAAAELEEFPRFNFEDAEPIVVVATLAYGGPLSLPECEPPRGLCMDTEPMWLRATVKQRVLGEVPDEFLVATTFHATRQRLEWDPDATWLLALRMDGDRYILGRGHQAMAHRAADGTYIVPLVSETLFWLPCAAAMATVEIEPRDVAPFMWWPRKGTEYMVLDRGNEVVFENERWRPRFALSSGKLDDALRNARAAGATLGCKPDAVGETGRGDQHSTGS